MKKISTTSFQYMEVVYLLWRLLKFYADAFCYIAPVEPLAMDIKTFEFAGIQQFQIIVQKNNRLKGYQDYSHARETMQHYLTYALLPESSLQPYEGGTSIYDKVERLYIRAVYEHPEDDNLLVINLMNICDELSFYNYKMMQLPKQI